MAKDKDIDIKTEYNAEKKYRYDAGYIEKRQLLNFFFSRSKTRVFRNYDDIIEYDLIETLREINQFNKKKGYIIGIISFVAAWDTIFSKFSPITKCLIGFAGMHMISEYFIYKNTDCIYQPLRYIFERNYRPILELD